MKNVHNNHKISSRNSITNDLNTSKALEGLFPRDKELEKEIAEDMRQHGFDPAHPIVARKGHKEIIDGGIRKRAAKEANVRPIIIEKEFETVDEAIRYKFHHQVNRRNWSLREIWEIIQRFGKNKVGRPSKKMRPDGSISELTDKELSRITGLSVRRIRKLRSINKKGSEELKAEVISLKKSISGAEEEVRGRAGNGDLTEREEMVYVDIDKICPNSFNPNEMTPNGYKALKNSVEKIGIVQPIECRRINDPDYKFEIINGEHRFTAAKELGHKKIPTIIIDVDEEEAKMRCLVMGIKGRARESKLAPLVNELKDKVKDFRKRTGLNSNRIKKLTTMCNTEVAVEYVPGVKQPLELEHGVELKKTLVNYIVFFLNVEDKEYVVKTLKEIDKNESVALKMLCKAYAEANNLLMKVDQSDANFESNKELS